VADISKRPLLGRRLVFVTGKGGVGKTTVAAALAELAAKAGQRTLICEMDDKGAVADAFDAAPLGFQPRLLQPNLYAMAMNTEDSLREYLRLFVRIPLLGTLAPLAKTFDFVADAAPGVKEILAVGKLAHEVRERHYDFVVVDAEASGHIVAQIGAPSAIRELVNVGMVRDQTDWMIDLLGDPDVTESIELLERLRSDVRVDVAAVVANRVLADRLDADQEASLDRLAEDTAREALVALVGPEIDTVILAARLAQSRADLGAGHLTRLRAALPADTPMFRVPELFARATGRRVVAKVAEALVTQVNAIDAVDEVDR
jgi:cellulose biosynthesis protein BcsQ